MVFHHLQLGRYRVCYTDKLLPNFDLTDMISIYTKDFSWEKWPKFKSFRIKQIPNCQFHIFNFQKVAKNIERFCFLSTFTPDKIFDSKIWLNYFLDDYHFGYITKSSKESLVKYVQSKLVQQVWSKHVYWEMMYVYRHWTHTKIEGRVCTSGAMNWTQDFYRDCPIWGARTCDNRIIC